MIASLPDELLKNIQQYCKRQDWKCLMDTSNACFIGLKYRTIDVFVDFEMLSDRVLPSIVAKLMNPLQQLHLCLDTAESIQRGDYFHFVEVKTRWKHPVKWRSTNLITLKDIKWFLSIPAKSFHWYRADPLLSFHPILMKALRKYEEITFSLDDSSKLFLYYYDDLNHSNHIKSLTIHDSWNFKAPILPSLIDLELMNCRGEVDLSNLVYSLSLKEVNIIRSKSYFYATLLPKQLKERGVILHFVDCLDVVEVDVEMRNEKEINDHEDKFDIYDEDEITVSSYGDEDFDESCDTSSDGDEIEEVDEEDKGN